MAGDAEHEDVGAGAKDALTRAGDDDGAHFGMLEADPVDRVVELDVDAEIVAVELQLVARAQPAVLVEIGFERGDGSVEGERPVAVFFRRSLIVDRLWAAHWMLLDRQFSA